MVRSYLDLLADRYGDDLDAEALEFLDYAADGAERMQAMIDGLLAYGRVETRGDPLEPVDLDDVLDDVIANLDLAIRETGADVVRGDLPVVEGDRGQLVQLFQNLVANALQYHDGSPRIRIDADRDGDRWTVSVADDGIGIPKDQQDRIFAIFQRGPGSQHGEGTGVGLAMCRRIVERHGGVIAVESTPGEGSTFTFTLPAVDEARRTEGRRAAT